MCDPVSLSNTNINILMHADDMLILSKSEWGLMECSLFMSGGGGGGGRSNPRSITNNFLDPPPQIEVKLL